MNQMLQQQLSMQPQMTEMVRSQLRQSLIEEAVADPTSPLAALIPQISGQPLPSPQQLQQMQPMNPYGQMPGAPQQQGAMPGYNPDPTMQQTYQQWQQQDLQYDQTQQQQQQFDQQYDQQQYDMNYGSGSVDSSY
jgi:hypothetical protein